MKVVLVTGSRMFGDRDIVWRALSGEAPDLLVVGDCPTGADLFAREWAAACHPPVSHRVFKADWTQGKRGGPIRNQQMVDYVVGGLPADSIKFCLAFFTIGAPNRGTTHCAGAARRAGLIMREFHA